MSSDLTKARRTSKAVLLAFLLIAAFAFVSCSRKAERITREEAMPIQAIIDAQIECSAEKYISAFPPDFIAAAEEYYEIMEGVPLEKFLYDSFLVPASENAEANFGKDFGAEFLVHALMDHSRAENPRDFENYVDYNVITYELDVTAIQKSLKAVGTLNEWGDDSEHSGTASYVLIMIDGKWYLHPMYFLTIY